MGLVGTQVYNSLLILSHYPPPGHVKGIGDSLIAATLVTPPPTAEQLNQRGLDRRSGLSGSRRPSVSFGVLDRGLEPQFQNGHFQPVGKVFVCARSRPAS